jgi:CDP-diacylglycerol--glycerol-3-phosphate 3-phosphatidyltransferase
MTTPRFNLPTVLTFSRIISIPFFMLVAPAHPFLGGLIFSAASLTDFLDGYIARKRGQITRFGILLDPIADKFLVISALILLVDIGSLSVFVAVIIIVREFLVTALRVVALSKNTVIPSEMGGKLKTAAQITAILCLILKDSFIGEWLYSIGINLYIFGTLFIWISLLLAVFSGIKYTVSFWKTLG